MRDSAIIQNPFNLKKKEYGKHAARFNSAHNSNSKTPESVGSVQSRHIIEWNYEPSSGDNSREEDEKVLNDDNDNSSSSKRTLSDNMKKTYSNTNVNVRLLFSNQKQLHGSLNNISLVPNQSIN